jgi:hypothetical protein
MPNGKRRPERSTSFTSWISEEEAQKLDAIAALLSERDGRRRRRVDALHFLLASGAVARLLKFGKWR